MATSYPIIQSFLTQNRCYKNNIKQNKKSFMQHSTATPGTKASAFAKSWNSSSVSVAVEFVVDDTSIYQCLPLGITSWHCANTANQTHIACEACEPYGTRFLPINWYTMSRTGIYQWAYVIEAIQKELKYLGYTITDAMGTFGTSTESAVKAYQKANGLTVNGEVNKATLQKMQTRVGSYVKYDPNKAENATYFKEVYKRCVWLAAYVLKLRGQTSITTSTLLCHQEGHKKGIASNHADVEHWWPLHGKTMDDFRADVKECMTTGKLPYETTSTSPSGDVDKAWTKACDMGVIHEQTPGKKSTRQDVAYALYKAGKI